MVDEAARTRTATGPRVLAPALAAPAADLRPARGVTGILLVVATVVTVVISFPEGVGTTVVRVAFVALWLSLPWLATEGITHLAGRSGAPRPVVRLTATLAWVGSSALWGGLTSVLLGRRADLGWALAAGAVAAALLVVAGALSGRDAPEPEPDPLYRGPFLD